MFRLNRERDVSIILALISGIVFFTLMIVFWRSPEQPEQINIKHEILVTEVEEKIYNYEEEEYYYIIKVIGELEQGDYYDIEYKNEYYGIKFDAYYEIGDTIILIELENDDLIVFEGN